MNTSYLQKIMVISILICFMGMSAGLGNYHVSTALNSEEFIDQQNGGEDSLGTILLHKGWLIAQSFIPTKPILSKVYLTLLPSHNPPVGATITVSIRDNLYGDDLTSVDVNADNMTLYFDFEDIEVIPDVTYYIVCKADKSSAPDNAYGWRYVKDDAYKEGCAWRSEGSNSWHEADYDVPGDGIDLFFITYWKDYSPEVPEINGPSKAKAQERHDFAFSAEDPEGDDIYLYIEWGDGKTMGWIGPFESGETVIKSHQWATKDDYTLRVKAKDIYGVESEYATFETSMSKQKTMYSPFLRFIENHDFPLLNYLLKIP